MSNKERLEEIKNSYLEGQHILFGTSWVSMPKENFNWLIEQVEKTEIYKEALENIEALSFFSDGFSDKEKFVAALYHAKKALEGEE